MSSEDKELETAAAQTAEEPKAEAESKAESEPKAEAEPKAESAENAAAPAKKQNRRPRKQVDPAVWDDFKAKMDNKENISVKINSDVKGGVVAYVNGVRGFIPASQLSIAYVEDLSAWVGKTIDVKVITVEPEDRRLVLSGKAAEKEIADAKAAEKMKTLQIGDVFEGTVDRLAPFGVFVSFDDGLSGLVHISQMANKRVEKPEDVCQKGDTVKVKVIGIDDGKIRLSMKQANSDKTIPYSPAGGGKRFNPRDPEYNYKEDGRATTNLGSLLKDIKIDE